MIFRLLIDLAWICCPGDWFRYATNTLERSIYEAVRSAKVDVDRLRERRRINWERIESLKTKGTPR